MNTQQQPNTNPLVILRNELDQRATEYAKVLPPGITPQMFARVAITAIQHKPFLLKCNRQSLLTAVMQAAEDGLLPDGREGALVPYKRRFQVEGNWQDEWIAQWLPMVEGVRKLLWESAGIILHTKVVYTRDEYDYQEGLVENPIFHRPLPGPRSADDIVAVYSIAKFPDGRRDWDWMWKAEIDQIAGKSRAGNSGPWKDPVFYPEMAIKTVVHHHSKTLPLSSQARRMIERGGDLVEMSETPRPARSVPADETIEALTYNPMEDLSAAPQRSVDAVMGAMTRGEPMPAAQPRRTRRTKEQMEAIHKQAEATAARINAGAGIKPITEIQSNEGVSGSDRVIVLDGDNKPYYQDTGEYIEDNNEAAEATASKQEPTEKKEDKTPDITVMDALRELMDSPQPENRNEYLAWVETKIEFAQGDTNRLEGLRQWWEITGGTRQQFGITQADIRTLGDKMRRQQPA